ncbi:hypothetical protein K7X08_013098 [Anisodus acutangulus]|uniref:Agenet domain-containing protein n=1 Tax=Anisodus acutangulus TaxID=402998 RepID=A0A9Q1MAI1_9SOLA|nr:hypothetical protein K7X08_013098 [Anisodus acutangulus]
MNGLVKDENQRSVGRKQNGSSWKCAYGYSQHRRCKSASDKNTALSKGGDRQSSVKKESDEPPVLPPSTRSCKASPSHEFSKTIGKEAVPEHRASLEKDIEQLQMRLQQEKSMRMVLERAMGRASSTLSPGHRHFAAQTKELIAEIEILEEEVANREQHVLSLYRSVFEECISRPSSEQSSVMTSPAHNKLESRKHPSIISSAFCSSKMFPLRTFQALAAINDLGKRNLSQSKSRHSSFYNSKANAHIQKSCSEHAKEQGQVPSMEKSPLARTLKDHLYQCPSKLSEEMVRCMAAIYCWLRITEPTSTQQKQSPLSSRSSTNVRIPQHDIKEERDWFCKSTIEISWIATDKNNFSRASYAISNYRVLVEQLERVNLSQMETNAKTAFWINLYNSLVMHAYLAYGIPQNSLRRLALFHKAAYNVGGQVISANAIEQSIFGLRTPRIGRWLETILSTALWKRSGEEKQLISSKFALQECQPLVCFALCTGAVSDPMLKVYTASNIIEELEAAKKEFLQANIVVKKSKRVFLPKVLERYAKETSIPLDNLLNWVMENVEKKLSDSIQKCVDRRANKKASQIIEWLPFSSRFQYVISKFFTEKPWDIQMDYNDNDYQSHLAGEDSSKVSSVLHPYALPKFDFDDSLQGHLRFDSLVENEVFLGIPTQEDNHWIEDFSRGTSGIEFSSSATDTCSIPRRNNVWSEATSTESVEMLLKSVGQEEMVPGDTIIQESDAGNQLGCLIQPAESSLKLDDKRDDVKDSSSAAPVDESVEFTGSFSSSERTKGEGIHIVCALERQEVKPVAEGCSDIAGERRSGVNTEEKLQTEIKSADENLGEAKTQQNESLPDKSDRQPSIPVVQSAINECLTDSLPTSLEILASQHNSANCHSGNTSGLPSEHHKPEEKQISGSRESSMGDEKPRGSAVESEMCTSNASPPSFAASELEAVKELPTETRMIKLEEPCVQRNECSLTNEGCKEDTSSVELPETVLSKGLQDKLQAEGNSILCEDEEASVSQNCYDTRDIENRGGSSEGQAEKASSMQISDGLTTSTEKEENNLDSHTPVNLVTSEACKISETFEPSKKNNGNGIHSEGPSNIQEVSVSAELVERPVPENLETGNDADSVSKGYACAGDHVSLSVPAGSMDIRGESFPHVVDVDTTNADVSGGKTKEEDLPVQNEMERSCVRNHGVRSSSGGEESEQISDQGHGSQFESSTLNKQASNAGFEGGNLTVGGDSVSVLLLSGSGAIATEIVDHDEKLKPVSVMGGSEHFAGKEEKEVVLSAEAEVSTLKTSLEGTGQLGPLSNDGKDAFADCHIETEPMIVDQNVLIQDNPGTAIHVEQAAIAEANSESCRLVEVCATNSGSIIKEGAGAGAEAVLLEKNQEMEVETVKLGEVGVGGSSDVIGGLKHDSAAVISCTALSSSEKKTTESRSRGVVENVTPLVNTIVIGGKAQSTSINSGDNASTKADRSFTFDVSPLAGNAKGEADKSITGTQACQPTELKAGDGLHLTSGSKQTDTKIVQEISHGSPLVPDKGTPSGGAKGDRKARRGSGKSGKENPRKGKQVKEINSSRQPDRGDKSCVQFSPSVAVQKMQFEAGTVDRNITKSSGVVSFPTSNLPDLNTSSPASVLFHQPFTDLQQVQLRAQIFVYGSLIQGTAPDEACMVSAFGTSDGGRSLWDSAWRSCVERIRGQRSHSGNNETPSHPRSGPRTPDQANKQVVHQNKVTTLAAGRAGGKATNSPAVSPMIPLSSPLWNMPTPSRDGLSSARGAVIDYKALPSMHPYQTPPSRNFVGRTVSWPRQAPSPGPWIASPQTSAFDISAQFPALPVTEPVKLTPVKESSLSISAGAKNATLGSVAHAGDSGILSGASPHDNKKASVLPAQYSADQKSRKRKKASSTEDRVQKSKLGTSSEPVTAPAICTQLSSKPLASDDLGQLSSVAVAPLVAQSQTGPASVPIIGGHFSTSVVIVPPSRSAPKSNSDILITSAPSSTDLSKRELDLGKKAPTSESKVEEAKLQAEEAAANAAAAVSHCQDVWSRLDKHKNSDLASDIEVKLTSAAVAVAAATSVAKAAAAAAKIASNAALQAKLMADEALIAYDVSNPSQTNAVSFPNIVNNLGSATPASVLKSQDVGNGSSSIIFAAREASRRRIEAASAASRHAENLDAIVKAAELAAEAVSHAGKVVALADPLPLTQLVEAGPDGYWKVSQTLSGHDVKANKVNGDELGIPIVEKTPRIFSKRSEGPSVEEIHPTIPACQPTSVSGNIIEDNMRNEEVIQTPVTGVEKDVRGAKGHSMPEASRTVGLVAESSHDLVEARGDVASSQMQEGSLVEVFKDGDDGKRAWYSGKVLTLQNGKVLVCYTDHQSEEGLEQLKDWVPLVAGSDEPPRIRPAHPVTALQGEKKRRRAAIKEYTWYVGDRVDAWIDYRWREGVIAEKNKRDETTFSVNFPAYGDTAVVRTWHLRPSLVWKDGEWVEWSRSRHGFLSQGDTPKEKRVKLGNLASEDTGNDSLSKKTDPLDPVIKELPLSANEKTFNIGSNKDDNKPNTLRTMRSGLQKEGSKVFGVPKPGKKRKFMEVSKHYVSDRATKSNAEPGSAKFTKYLMPQATGIGGWKNNPRTDLKEKQAIEARRKLPKPSKPPSSARNLKNNSITSTRDASGADHTVGDAIEYDKHEAQQPNVVNFVSNAEEGAEGPVTFRSEALPTKIPKKASTSSNRGEGMRKKIPVSNLKSSKVEVKDKMTPEVNEPRRSNRRIQPTSRLLEGLQSSLIISKFPSVSHDKGSRNHSRGASR